MYNTDYIPQVDDGFLYHFTTAEALIKILSNMTFKSSLITRMNDLNECDVDLCCSNSVDHWRIRKYIQNHCKLISFSKNFRNKTICEFGYNHPRMWAQYSENNAGACIVINEKKLISDKENIELLKGVIFSIDDVKYDNPRFDIQSNIETDEESFVKANFKSILFKKHLDWQQEEERRYISIDGPNHLSIESCIEYIILGSKFSNTDYINLVNTIVTMKIRLRPHDFAKQTNVFGNVLALDEAFLFLEHVKKIHNNSADYLAYLRECGYEI